MYHGDTITIEKRMDASIHIRNKNGKYILTKELPELPAKLSKLPLLPVISEDVNLIAAMRTVKLEYMTHLQEDVTRKQTERKQKRNHDKNALSLLRQEFYREHDRHVKFDPHWTPSILPILT